MTIVSVKSRKNWKTYSNFCLGISLGSKNHEGEALEAIVDWLNRAEFSQGRVDFSDTLHRFNIMMDEGIDEKTARKRILEESGQWIRENYEVLTRLNMPYEFIFWDHWLSHPDFPAYQEKYEEAYTLDNGFRQAILNDVSHYFMRRENLQLSEVPLEKIKLSAAFLIEELAAHSILYDTYPCAVVYPGREQESFKLVRSGQVKDIPVGMKNSFHTRLVLHNVTPVIPFNTNDNGSTETSTFSG